VSFQAFDSDSKGYVTPEDFKKGFESVAELFNELGVEMTDPSVLTDSILNSVGKKKIFQVWMNFIYSPERFY
jgi:Ca2+-binding EF-hand superfamily protein